MCSLCRLPVAKNHNFGQILTFWKLLYRPPFTDVLQQTHGIRLPAKFRLDRFILSSCGCEKPQFLPFLGLRHLVVSPIGSSLRKSNTGALRTFPYPTVGIKIVSVLSRLHGEIGRTISDVQKRDEQTNKQTKNSPFLAAPAAGEIRVPPNFAR